MKKFIKVDAVKYNQAYHDVQKCMYEIKRLSALAVKASAEMLECIEEDDDGK